MTEEEAVGRWEEARTLEDVGELTAQWLEGVLHHHPNNGESPDEETSEIRDFLIYFNRNGFVTTFSQPAEILNDAGSAQRACVEAIASERLATQLATLTLSTELLVFAFPIGVVWGYQIPITMEEFRPYTWCGSSMTYEDVERTFNACTEELVETLANYWSVIIIDLQWGRNNFLWEQITNVLNNSHDTRFSSVPYDSESLGRDFHF